MKTSFVLFVLFTAALNAFAAAPLSPISAASAPVAFNLQKVTRPNNVELERGDSLMTARRLLGAPHRELSPNVWAYYGYYPATTKDSCGCDTLIVTFVANQVANLQIVNPSGVQVIAANLKAPSAKVLVAQK